MARVPAQTRILFCGDLVGSAGRRALLALLPELRERHDPTFVLANAENVAGGFGITPALARELLGGGVDVITLGNHAYRRREIYPYLDAEPRILRPANYLHGQPGHGHTIVTGDDGVRLAVVNLSGNVFMSAGRSAFAEADALVERLAAEVDHIVVDMHAEATSEKVAMGWHLDGRVTAVIGTHTHVPTADARVLPGGTAYITDVGMTGARGGVLGVERRLAVAALVTQMPVRLEPSDDDPWLDAVLVRAGERLRADAIEQLLVPAPR
jgi:2',3'-cyclic-nucleotide 2'-phosphodiesterase